MQAVQPRVHPRFGLLSLHTTGKHTDAYLYQIFSPGEVRLNHLTILRNSADLLTLEESMQQVSSKQDLVQQIQQPLIRLVQNLPLKPHEKTRLVAMLTAPKTTRVHIQRNDEDTPTRVRFSDRGKKA
jgi:hypothetical protein